MARLVKLQSQIQQVRVEFFTRQRIAEENRKRENAAAVKIQSWVRGCRVRAYVRYLSKHAVIVQRTWRGFSARALFRHMQEVAYLAMRMKFYNQMAVRIQRRWRGYYVRRNVHNYYERKKYLEALSKKNEEIRKELEEFGQYQQKERDWVAVEREEKKKYQQAQRQHFLLSTIQCPGVYNSPFRGAPSEMEERMRRVTPVLAQSAARQAKSKHRQQRMALEQQNASFLPPINAKKPQGPFRAAEEVWRQRQRPLEPSLRVATSISALEEAREQLRSQELSGRLIDHPFWPFASAHKSRKYQPLIHTRSAFQPLPYGTKHFREDTKHTLQDKEAFKTVFTTCHVFDKYGRLYSNAGNMV